MTHSASRRVRTALAPPAAPAAVAVCALSFLVFVAAQRFAEVSMIDLAVYRAEGRAVLDGADLYALRVGDADLPMTYPPFAALLFTPLTLLVDGTMRAVATAANLGLLVALVHLSLRLADRRPNLSLTLTLSALAVWCEPVWTTLRYGQINLLLAVLVLWDLSRADRSRWAGVGIGIAAAIKLTPALFAVFLLVTGLVRLRRGGDGQPWLRRAAVAAGAFLAVTAATAVVLPADSQRFWTRIVFAAGRVGHAEETANQSLRGVLARLLHTGDPGLWWYALALPAAAGGLAVAVTAALRGRRAWAAAACGLTALLVSPVSWSHHWVWCVPVLLLLGTEAIRRRTPWARTAAGATAAVFYGYALWLVPHGDARPELAQHGGQMLLSALYPLAAACLLALVPVLTRSRRSRSA
ncbi:glycosyltransferase 87 family protein [Streptomyces sp. NPDC060194]|uniref:glycosyltransferase 87 family protein n=1 Tax=Streptomyces sp. NPDC060194 TaxID=3347069 RepID=UPI003646FD8D